MENVRNEKYEKNISATLSTAEIMLIFKYGSAELFYLTFFKNVSTEFF